jgi:hypothetical protein
VTAYVQKESIERKGYRHRSWSKGSDRVFKRDKGIILSPAEQEAEEASALFLESEERIKKQGKAPAEDQRGVYESNVKKDIKNKIAHYVVSNYQHVAFQDDDIRSWQVLYGIKILETLVGESAMP